MDKEVLTGAAAHNATISEANEEIARLQAGGLSVRAKEGIYGVDIEIERPSWRKGYVSRSTRIIPWKH